MKKLFLIFSLVSCCLCLNAAPVTGPERGFTSWTPARNWEEALLAGNGTVGAMVIGRPYDETIILNHGLIYLPANAPFKPIDQASRMDEIRHLMLNGEYQQAAQIPVEISGKVGYNGTEWTDSFMPAFDILVNLAPSNIKNYHRSVDFATGEAGVNWLDDAGEFTRNLFVSRSDSIVVLQIKGAGKISGSIGFSMHPYEWHQRELINRGIDLREASAEGQWLTYRSNFKNGLDGNPHGYEGVGRLIVKSGDSRVDGNRLVFTDAEEVLLLVQLEPNYDWTKSLVERLKKNLAILPANYDSLLTRHVAIHGDLFNRVKLDLGVGEATDLFSETLVLQARRQVTPAIVEKLFDAARYNIMSATGTNPPNLQGIWTGIWAPPWSSDFTHNGNLPVAVSGFLCGNMPELMFAFFDYHDRMLPYYRDNTRRLYGCRGIHIPSHTSTHGWDIHFNETWCMTFWTAGAGWAANFYFDYWLYTGDEKFLRERAFPFMKEAALFYEDFLTVGEDDKYVFNPSYSPENTPANSNSQACINATMDVMVAKQLLRNCIDAAIALQGDTEEIKKWRDMLEKMPAYELNESGVLKEWLWSGLEDNHGHRHISQLYGLYDLMDPEISQSEALKSGSLKVIEERMKMRRRENGGVMAFGLVQMAFVTTNLRHAEFTGEILNWLAGKYWGNSLSSRHDPGSLFNMDISGGFPAAVIRALAWSEPGKIILLPALPPDWKSGSISGILLRGQIEMESLTWSEKEISAKIKSGKKQNVEVRVPQIIDGITGDADMKITQPATETDRFSLSLEENDSVYLAIKLK